MSTSHRKSGAWLVSGTTPTVFPAAFHAVAQSHPDVVAVSDQDRHLTYRELDELSDRVAANLCGQSVGPGVAVGLLMERSVDAVAAVLAVLKAQGAFLPLDPAYPEGQLRRMVETAQTALLVVADGGAAARLDAQVPAVVMHDLLQPAVVRHDLLRPAEASRRDPPRPDHLAYVTHTSGSTHYPKAVAVSHRSLAVAADGWLDTYRLRDQPMPHLQYAGFGFDVFIQDLARCLLSGGTLIICPPAVRLDPPALATFIEAHRIAFAEFTPTLLTLLLDYCELSDARLPSIRMLAVGGEPWRVGTYRRVALVFPQALIVNTYGLAESTIDNLAHVGAPPADLPDDRLMPLGRPHSGTEMIVVDVDTGQPVASGTGELCLAGTCLGQGYLGQPELTAERYVAHPVQADQRCLRTGDLVNLDQDGTVHYLGRLDDQVKVRGVRVMLGQVEAALAAHPAVQRVVVRAATGATGDELTAHVVAADLAPPVEELRELVRRSLVAEAVPSRIQFHDTLPVSANGKVDRARLASSTDQPPASAGEHLGVAGVVAVAWQEVLGRDSLAPDDNFFACGGDSVAAAWVAMRVGVAVGAHVPPYMLYENPTFAGFVSQLSTVRHPAPAIQPRADQTTHPLSPAQRRLWLLSQLQPDHATYVVPTVIDLRGPLERKALEAALADLVARHEPLRTVVDGGGAEPICRVLEPGPVPVQVERAEDEDDARDRAVRFVRRPFVLDEQPPIRVQLIALGPRRHWLVFAVHHIATDGESTRIILDELGRLYDAALAGVPADLEPLRTTYGDVAVWQAEQSTTEVNRRLGYWLDKLRGYADHPLALESPDPDRPSDGDGHRITRWLGGEVTAQVRAAARAGGTTVFVALLAAIADLARRWSGSTDICIGYPVSSRELAATRDLVGFFIDTRVVRADLAGHVTFPSLVRRVHREAAEATAGGGVPFDQIAEALDAEGHRGPVFRVWFNHLGPPEQPPRMRGITTSVLDAPLAPALFDLNIYVTESADDIRIDLVQDLARSVPDAAEELLEQYLGLVGTMLAEPDVPVRRHRPQTRRSAALPSQNDPLEHAAPPALAWRLMRLARRRAGDPALRDEHASYGYRRARDAVGEAAQQLRRCGVRPGDVVAVRGRRSASLVIAIYATLAAGGRVLMLDPGYPDGRSASYLSTARPRCLILAEPEPRAALPTIANAVPVPVLGIGGDGQARVLRATEPDPAATNLGSAGYVAFTSGTTGGPTAVTGNLTPVSHFLNWYAEEFQLGPADRFALLAGLSHDPLFRDILAPAWCGGTLCVPSPETYLVPTSLLDWLGREEVTVAHLTPPLARLLLEAAGRSVRLPALRLVCLAGDAVTTADVARLSALAPHAVLLNGYGTTETPQLVSRQVLVPGRTPALGCGAPGSQLLVLDTGGGLCGIGEPGQIVVRSRHLVERLLTTDDETHLDADPVAGVRRFATGDLGRYQTDGSVIYIGRSDTTVKIRGFRASPEEVDRVLASDPRIATSITVPRPGPDGPELVTYVVASGRAPISPVQLRARLGVALPAYLLPTSIVPLERLPLTMNGKVNIAALPTVAVTTPADPARVPPESPMEHRLARIFSTVLGVEQVGVTDNFFDLGGDSLKMIRLHATIGREVDATVSLLALYQHPSVRSLARSLSHDDSVAALPRQARRPAAGDERSRRLHARQQVAGGSALATSDGDGPGR
jgi:amino acid adenylation domain-containing protein